MENRELEWIMEPRNITANIEYELRKKSKRETLVVDLDGVIHDTFSSVLRIMNILNGYNYTYEELSWAMGHPKQNKDLELRKLFDSIWRNENNLIYKLNFLELDVLDLIKEYQEAEHEIVIYTANENIWDMKSKTELMTKAVQEGVIKELPMVFSLGGKPPMTATTVIEDTYENLQVYDNNVEKILIKRPWNEEHWDKRDIRLMEIEPVSKTLSIGEDIKDISLNTI